MGSVYIHFGCAISNQFCVCVCVCVADRLLYTHVQKHINIPLSVMGIVDYGYVGLYRDTTPVFRCRGLCVFTSRVAGTTVCSIGHSGCVFDRTLYGISENILPNKE